MAKGFGQPQRAHLAKRKHDAIVMLMGDTFELFQGLNVSYGEILDALATHTHKQGINNEVVKAIEEAARIAHDSIG